MDVGANVPSMLAHIRKLMAWNWDQVAFYLDRSRPLVRSWALGQELAPASLERLRGLCETLVYIDRGHGEANHSLLSMTSPDGLDVGQLLRDGQFTQVRALLGPGEGRRDTRRFTLLAERVLMGEDHWYDRLLRTGGRQVVVEPSERPKKRRVAVRPR